jgi:proline iminopeptidase
MRKIIQFLMVLIIVNTYSQTEYFVTSKDQTKIHINEVGAGEPIVILAGGPGMNAVYMNAVIDSLSLHFKCIVLNQRGTGKSLLQKVDSTALTMTNYVNDIEAIREHLELDKITIVGHSWGGMLAMEYASKRPENINNLVLLNPGGPTGNFFTYYGDNIYMRLHEDDIKEIENLSNSGKSTFGAIFPGYFFEREKALEVKGEIDFKLWFGQPGGITGLTITNYISSQNHRVNNLKTYFGPVSILLGRQDPIGASTVFEIKDLLPQSEIYFVEKCGHFPWLENEKTVEEFYKLVYSLLSKD